MRLFHQLKRFFLALSVVTFFVFPLYVTLMPVADAGFVPCGLHADDTSTGDSNESSPCTLCHLVIGIKRLIDWALKIMTFFAIAVIVAMGILYIVSVGDTKMTGMAKEGLKASIYGFALMLLIWLFVAVILATLAKDMSNFKTGAHWYEFTCSTTSNVGTSSTSGDNGGSSGTGGTNTYTNSDCQALNPAGRCSPTSPTDGNYTDKGACVGTSNASDRCWQKSTSGSGSGSGGSTGGGSCSVVTDSSNACATQNMRGTCFESRAQDASKICNFESGGRVDAISGTDHCSDGASFSHGIWQINLVTSGSILPSACQGVFTGNMDCIEHTTNSRGVRYCSKRNCRVARPDQQAACLSAIRDPQTNTSVACKLYNASGNFKPWPHTRQTCGIN